MRTRRVSRVLTAILASILLAVAVPASSHSQTGKLAGSWTAVSAERDGKPADELKGHRLTFRGDNFVIDRDNRIIYRGTFKSDHGKKPATIDFRNTEGEAAGKTWLGIYRLEGDDLTIVDNAPDTDKPRPAKFTTTPGSGHVLLAFKRMPGR
jgi:uncharacterized protein (TIGR03067 family)